MSATVVLTATLIFAVMIILSQRIDIEEMREELEELDSATVLPTEGKYYAPKVMRISALYSDGTVSEFNEITKLRHDKDAGFYYLYRNKRIVGIFRADEVKQLRMFRETPKAPYCADYSEYLKTGWDTFD